MSRLSWFVKFLRGDASNSARRPRPSYKPGLETLEERSLPSVTPLHLYNLNGTLTDELGGPALTADGGALDGGRYVFGANQGLQLSGGLTDTSNYSVIVVANLDSLDKFFNKVVDFQARASDFGLYVAGGHLQFYPGAAGPDAITANQDFQITLT